MLKTTASFPLRKSTAVSMRIRCQQLSSLGNLASIRPTKHSRSLTNLEQQLRQQQHQQQVAWKSTSSSLSLDENAPTLVEVPSLPIVGSVGLPTSFSGMPKMDQSTIFQFWPEMRRRFGDFYSFGIFGLGRGSHGTVHVIQDPNEMARIVRQEGKFPAGAAEFAWAFRKYMKDRGSAAAGLLSRGAEWKRIRNFVQTDLLAPASAARYLPLVIEAAPGISRGAPDYADNMNTFLNLASFEMFSNVMVGELPRVLDPTYETDEEDLLFCESTANALRLSSQMSQKASEAILANFGIQTKLYKEFQHNWDVSQEISKRKIDALLENRKNNRLTPNQESCYTNVAFDRVENEENKDNITNEEAVTIVGGLLSAGVDTTGGNLSFKLLHVATSPDAQDKIYHEIQKNGGEITPETVSAANAPYLHAALRESHRLANSNVMIPMKMIPNEVTVHGVELPKDSVIVLDGYSTGINPDLVDEPMEYRPERFLKDAVMARKGTPSQVVDHAFFSGPFSQGARKCPGSRVANLETAVMIAQLVKDWEISVPNVRHWTEVPYKLDTLTTAQLPPMKFTPRQQHA